MPPTHYRYYIHLNKNGNKLSVSAGGTLANNTYKWYKDGKLFKTKTGDSSVVANKSGTYFVEITNSVATGLTLNREYLNIADANAISSASQVNTKNKVSPISVYPNPAKTTSTLVFNATGKYTIIIADFSGKALQTKTGIALKGINTVQLDVSKYAGGIYLCTITDEANRIQKVKLSKE